MNTQLYQLVNDDNYLATFKFLAKQSEVSEIALDTETCFPRDPAKQKAFQNIYSLIGSVYAPVDPHTADVRLVQLKAREGPVFIVDLYKTSEVVKQALIAFLELPKRYILQNSKFDMKMIKSNLGLWIYENSYIYDTYQMSILLGNAVGMGKERGHGLKDLARDFLDIQVDKTEQASDWSVPDLSPDQLEYAMYDVYLLHDLKDALYTAICDELGMGIALDIDLKCLGPTAKMEYNGLPFNLSVYEKVQEAAQYAMPSLLGQIGKYFFDEIKQPLTTTYVEITDSSGEVKLVPYKLPWGGGKAGKSFLMSKTAYVLPMLQKLGLTNDDGELIEDVQRTTLTTFKDRPGVKALLDYWMLVKQEQFNYKDYVHPITKRIHPRFQAGAASTGRFGCSGPNVYKLCVLT